ncbi:MAG: LysR family transcriptional regulator [Nitrospiraceae bacterium]
MELRHLRRFIAVAEELHFSRAAKRLHIEQSPLSRSIKELEKELDVRLFDRDHRNTHLTQAGHVFLKDVRRLFTALEYAKESAKAIASGHSGLLRIALSDGAAYPRLAALLAMYREEEPTVGIQLTEVSLTEQLRGLRNDTFDAGFARSENVGTGIEARPVWHEPLVVAVPSRHPLLVHRSIPLEDLVRYPLVMYHPGIYEGYCRQVERLLSTVTVKLEVVERVTSLEMMLTLVAAGYGAGFVAAEQVALSRHPDVIVRPLAMDDAAVTTYLLTKINREASERMDTFIGRATGKIQDSD